jgi:hypothetical protein
MKRSWLSRAKETVILTFGAIVLLVYIEWINLRDKRSRRGP